MFQISVGNLKINQHDLINMSKDTFVSAYENDYIGDINDAWERVKDYAKPFKSIQVKTKKGG